jgi:CubicO group peptidase (beta-lactamase class C family)
MALEGVRGLMEAGIAAGLHLGGQLYVSRRGEVVADLAVGESRPGRALRRDELMLWLSSTKPVAAVAIAQLWERGALGLDDPVARHIPEFAAGGKQGITLRHLLTHTGGFRMLDVGWPEASWEEILARVCAARREPRWTPGEKGGYHTASSWFVLGELVRRLDGRPFERYAREEIFLPLEMSDCWVGMPAERFAAYGERLAPMWDTTRDPPAALDWHGRIHATRCSPAGGGWGPMRELGRFYEALLAGGSYAGARVLRPQTVEALVARHRTGLLDHTFKKVMDWGLGLIPNPAIYQKGDQDVPYAYGPHASRRAFGHSGQRSSTAFADPEHGLVVALAVNGLPAKDDHQRRFRSLTAAVYEDLGLVAPANAVP